MFKNSLDKIDKQILAELDKNCRISNAALGKKVRKSRETVKYRIRQLQERGVLAGFITSINPNKLGFSMFKVYLKLENIPTEKEKFMEALKENKDVYWIGVCDGAFDLVFAMLSRSVTGYFKNMNALLSKWEHLIISKVLGTMVDTKQYNKKFFLPSTPGSEVAFGGDTMSVAVDVHDYTIISLLANDARMPLVQLARKARLSIPTVRSRLRHLEETGVILGYRISVDLNKLGLEFFKAIIYFRTFAPKDDIALSAWMRAHPSALYYIRSLAPWEAELEFAVESYQEFNRIISDLRQQFPSVIRNHEHLIMSYETWLPALRAEP